MLKGSSAIAPLNITFLPLIWFQSVYYDFLLSGSHYILCMQIFFIKCTAFHWKIYHTAWYSARTHICILPCLTGASSQSLPLEPCQVGPDSFPPCLPLSLNDIPNAGAYFDVFVTYAANPNNFAVSTILENGYIYWHIENLHVYITGIPWQPKGMDTWNTTSTNLWLLKQYFL